MAKSLSPEAQRVMEEFLAERARLRSEMIEQAGFPAPLPPVPVSGPAPAPAPRALPDEDELAGEILARVDGGLPTTAAERLYLRRKLFAVPAEDKYIPAPIRTLPSKDKLLLDARLTVIDRAERKP